MINEQPNQTQFISQAPWHDQTVVTPVEEPNLEEEIIPKKRPTMLIVALIAGTLLLLLILLAVILRPRMVAPDDRIPNGFLNGSAELTELEQRVASLSSELKAADPVKSEFPFPPVKMDLSLPSPSPQL